MHPFHWVPALGERHASTDPRPSGGYPAGSTITTLCDRQMNAEVGEMAWLWTTCPACNAEAHRMVGGVRQTAYA
ncbi:zinc finger protein [Saccharopolyspora flava]|uniref:Zinc-finger n=1 Tax=Saccharopolyspora flava TaxID=95161 RepID=A0A1I6S2K7_9PSEU|nr:zinc finger protein [Saccharopolyspora flava]SFS71177.1 zinc-finger [Saccharopolyspora flava]